MNRLVADYLMTVEFITNAANRVEDGRANRKLDVTTLSKDLVEAALMEALLTSVSTTLP